MGNSRTENTAKTIIWGYAGNIMSIIVYFISRTIFIYTIGASVREKENSEQFCKIYPNANWVLCPTLLSTKDEWNEVALPRVIKEKYLFCYFIGLNKDSRRIVKLYADAHGLKLVLIPHLNNTWTRVDSNFGNCKLDGVSPSDCLSFIKHAECVFTDSFHATVFSNVFEKDFFVFNKGITGIMNNKIYSFLGMFEREERFIDKPKMNIEYLNSFDRIDYSREIPIFSKIHQESCAYLDACLKQSSKALVQRDVKNE